MSDRPMSSQSQMGWNKGARPLSARSRSAWGDDDMCFDNNSKLTSKIVLHYNIFLFCKINFLVYKIICESAIIV